MSNQFTHGYALLVGVDANAVAGWALPDVAKDVAALAQVLAHPNRCAYPAGNVKVIQGQAPPARASWTGWTGCKPVSRPTKAGTPRRSSTTPGTAGATTRPPRPTSI